MESEADLAIKCGSGAVVGTAVVGIAVVGIAVVGTAVVGIAAVGIAACTPTSYRSSTATIALNCLVFEKIAFFCILATDRQTNRRKNRWTAPMH